jgi:hypothetical protein
LQLAITTTTTTTTIIIIINFHLSNCSAAKIARSEHMYDKNALERIHQQQKY